VQASASPQGESLRQRKKRLGMLEFAPRLGFAILTGGPAGSCVLGCAANRIRTAGAANGPPPTNEFNL
jgi:hypothetical protein